MKLLRLKEVTNLTGLSKNTIRRLETNNRFPSRRKISDRRIGWVEEDINNWIEETEKKQDQQQQALAV